MKQSKTLFAGRTALGERVWVEITLDERADVLDKGFTTIEHEKVAAYTQLSVSGSMVGRGSRTVCSGGQNVDDLFRVTNFSGSALTAGSRDELVRIWRRWHLNGMVPGCAHMDLPADKRYEARKGITCPETGYQYGHDWLVELLPMQVLTTVRGLMTLPSGDVPSYV